MITPLVSIIIPFYNAEDVMQHAIDSAINQTYKNIEIILINDGSTDGSDAIVTANYLTNEKVRYIKNDINEGQCAATNIGINIANGHYLQFLDADDYLELNKIELQLRGIDSNEHLLISNYWEWMDRRNIKSRVVKTDRPDLLKGHSKTLLFECFLTGFTPNSCFLIPNNPTAPILYDPSISVDNNYLYLTKILILYPSFRFSKDSFVNICYTINSLHQRDDTKSIESSFKTRLLTIELLVQSGILMKESDFRIARKILIQFFKKYPRAALRYYSRAKAILEKYSISLFSYKDLERTDFRIVSFLTGFKAVLFLSYLKTLALRRKHF
jgi:glycosyltransferase involved in cell wall biosynthesis